MARSTSIGLAVGVLLATGGLGGNAWGQPAAAGQPPPAPAPAQPPPAAAPAQPPPAAQPQRPPPGYPPPPTGYPPPPGYAPAPQPYAYPPSYVPPPVAPATDRTDPQLPAGITFLSVGALLAVTGGPLLAQEDERVCGIDHACVERPEHTRDIAAAALLGGGIGMAVVALPALIAGVGRVPKQGYRRSHGMTAAGAVLSALGGGLLGAGIGALAADDAYGPRDASPVWIPFLAVGGALTLAGAPLWAVGTMRIETPEPQPQQAPASARRSSGGGL